MGFKITNYVKLPAFLQFLGYMLLFLALIFLKTAPGFWPPVLRLGAFVAGGVGIAGFLYDKIYQ